jgi:hypothetical protein
MQFIIDGADEKAGQERRYCIGGLLGVIVRHNNDFVACHRIGQV